jgi:DUF4097 and DUF4098 domain-containing protein YvlB
MKDDVLRVLKMIEEGKIDSQKGAELIEALKEPKVEEKTIIPTTNINFNDERMLKVKVVSAERDNVNVQLPVKFIKGVIAACGKMPLNVQGMEGIDMQLLLQAMDSGLTGKIVDVKSANGDIVEVVIE